MQNKVNKNKFFIKDLCICRKWLSYKLTKQNNATIHVYKNTEFIKDKTAKIDVKTKLGIGRIIDYTGSLKTTFIMQKNSSRRFDKR